MPKSSRTFSRVDDGVSLPKKGSGSWSRREDDGEGRLSPNGGVEGIVGGVGNECRS